MGNCADAGGDVNNTSHLSILIRRPSRKLMVQPRQRRRLEMFARTIEMRIHPKIG